MSDTVFSKTVLGQTLYASGAGIFQVYSGGIAIDTVSTRMQAGMPAQHGKPSLERDCHRSLPCTLPTCLLAALYGPAAMYRAFYTGHGVLALNFMRHKVEHFVDSASIAASKKLLSTVGIPTR